MRIKILFYELLETVRSMPLEASYLRALRPRINMYQSNVSHTALSYEWMYATYQYLWVIYGTSLELGLDDESDHQDQGGPERVPAREKGNIADELDGVLEISLSSLASIFSEKWEL